MQFRYTFIAVIVAATLLSTTRCARMGRPEGGPRDSTPPILLKTTPKYGATNYHKKTIRLTFNEYILLKEPTKNFLVSPPPQKQPTLTTRGKSVIVEFKSPPADSTTHLLHFGSAITDNNEGNPFPNYRFAFSTDNYLDSLRMTGIATNAATGEPLPNATICLYTSTNDSAPLTLRPQSIARSDQWGFFVFENIKPINYKVVLLTDENKNYKYDPGQESIAFLDSAINPANLYPPLQWLNDTTSITDTGSNREAQFTLRAFKEDVRRQFMMSAARTQRKAFTLIFNAPFPITDSINASVPPANLIAEHSPLHDTTIFWLNDTAANLPDSLWLTFRYQKTDSAGEMQWSRERIKLFFDLRKEEAIKEAAKAKEKDSKKGGIGSFLKGIVGIADSDTTYKKPAHWSLKPAIAATHSPIHEPAISFAAPIFAINKNLISIDEIRINPKRKDTIYAPLPFALIPDTLRIRKYRIHAQWKPQANYRYRILPQALVDIYSQTTDTLQGTFTAIKDDQVAILTLKCKNVSQPYLIQLMDAKGNSVHYQRHISSDTARPAFTYLAPAAYRVRIIKDDNNNHKWDNGNYLQRQQPEHAAFLKNTDGTTQFPLKANWDQELSVDLASIFPAQRLRSLEMDFPFTDILTDSIAYINFCNDAPSPTITKQAQDWLLFCNDDHITTPSITTDTTIWTTFCDDQDPPATSIEETTYIEFCPQDTSPPNPLSTGEGELPNEQTYENDFEDQGLCDE